MAPDFPPSSKVVSKPPPVGGLNARDAYSIMPETDAIQLRNWIPDTGGVRCRKGYSEWATNLGIGNVEAIFPYFTPSTPFPGGAFLVTPTTMPGKLFAATPDDIYDITTSTDAPVSVQSLSGAANAGWFSNVVMSNTAGTFLLAVSEIDGYFTYDGAAWVKVTLGGGATQVSVVDPTTFCHVALWKRRAWFVIRNSAKAAYLPVDSLYGAAAAFDFGPLFKHGGSIAYIANWTIDAGEGIDDFLVVVGLNGDVLVYKGTDPTSASTFALVGSWFVGQIPIGRRAYTQFGGDLVLASADGIFPISYITRGGADVLVASAKEYSSKIRPKIGVDLRASFTVRGWQMMLHPSERVMIVNVPDYGSVQSRQYVMSTSLNEWCDFLAIPIYTLGSTAGYTFAGTRDGRVLLVLNGFYDNVAYGESIGDGIAGFIQPAFSNMGSPALQKQFLALRPVFLSQTVPQYSVDISVNYQTKVPVGNVPAGTNFGAGIWNIGLWNDAIWGGNLLLYSDWETCGDIGFVGSAVINTLCTGDTVLAQVDYLFQSGGIF